MSEKIEEFCKKKAISKSLVLFFIFISLIALGQGFSGAIFPNFYKDAYNITAMQRAFIEFPREMPGFLCLFILTFLSFLGDVKIAVLAQITTCIGALALGILSPSFSVMLIFLFIHSIGQHLLLPLRDSIGMSLAESDRIGYRMGQYSSMRFFFSVIAGLIVFIGFRSGFFSFKTHIKSVFVIAAVFYGLSIIIGYALYNQTIKDKITILSKKREIKFYFRKEYKYYYMITILCGVQKQIALVFGSWVIIDLLSKGADVMSVLIIFSSFIGIFFLRVIGNWIDKLGIKKVMYLDAISFIVVYTIYGIFVWLIVTGRLPRQGIAVALIYTMFILDKMSMQFSMIRSVYLKSIAVSEEEISSVLSTGISLDHAVAMLAAQLSGIVWMKFGPHWVFFIAAFLSLGNLYAASKVKETKALQR